MPPIPQDPWWKQSHFLPIIQEKVVLYKAYLPEQIAENFDFDRGVELQPLVPATSTDAPEVVEPVRATEPSASAPSSANT